MLVFEFQGRQDAAEANFLSVFLHDLSPFKAFSDPFKAYETSF